MHDKQEKQSIIQQVFLQLKIALWDCSEVSQVESFLCVSRQNSLVETLMGFPNNFYFRFINLIVMKTIINMDFKINLLICRFKLNIEN